MSNHFEFINGCKDVKEEASLNRICKKVADEILQNNYRMNYKAWKFINKFADETGRNIDDLVLDILERFNHEQGALPGELEEKYISLAFNSAAVRKKMIDDNCDFRKAAAAIASNIAKKGIVLVDQELVKKTVTAAELENENGINQNDEVDMDAA